MWVTAPAMDDTKTSECDLDRSAKYDNTTSGCVMNNRSSPWGEGEGTDAESGSYDPNNETPTVESQGDNLTVERSPSRGSGANDDIEHYYNVTGNAQGEEDGRYEDLPLVFQFPNSADESAKIYCCHICNFKTAFKNSLVNHQAVHSDIRPWICEICDYAAKRKQDLKKHLHTMHGLMIDSLALKPGINPATGGMMPSGLSSPVETKPQIVNNVVVSPTEGFHGISGPGASFLVQHHALGSLLHSVPTPGQMTHPPRTLPGVGKHFLDKFSFSQIGTDGEQKIGFPRLNAHTAGHLAPFAGYDNRSDLSDASTSGDGFSSNPSPGKPRSVLPHSGSEKRMQSVNEVMTKESFSPTDDKATMRTHHISPKVSIDSSREATARSEAQTSSVHLGRVLESDFGRGQKRPSLDSRGDSSPGCEQSTVAGKILRFQSPVSATAELSPHVSSQSENISMMEPMSSTAVHSRALETKKSFHCSHCDILFFENALYLMHMGLHGSNNPWKCSICGRTFFEKYSFTSHFINQH